MTLMTVMLPSGLLTVHGSVLRQDRDALFLLQIPGVHQAFDRVITPMRQRSRLTQHRVDEGRLPMIDVCHDGDIPEIHGRIIPVQSAYYENERLPSL